MLNLMSFREMTDYFTNPDRLSGEPIYGREAFKEIHRLYPTLPNEKRCWDCIPGKRGNYFMGLQDERWDLALMIRS